MSVNVETLYFKCAERRKRGNSVTMSVSLDSNTFSELRKEISKEFAAIEHFGNSQTVNFLIFLGGLYLKENGHDVLEGVDINSYPNDLHTY